MNAASLLAGASALDLAVRATLLIGAAWAAAAMLSRLGASAATRHLAWLLGIAALLALPLVWWLAPPLRLPILSPEVAATAGLASPGGAAAMAAEGLAESGPPIAAWSILAIYLIGVAALSLRLGLSHLTVARLWRSAAPAGADWQMLLASVSRDMRLRRPVALRIADRPVMPMTWGTLAPKLLLPIEACTWPAEQRRLVLLHELAHVARRDSLGRSAAALACALYWFHPGAWFAARRLRLEQEHAADDRVLTLGAPPRGYALNLLDLARRVGGRSWPDHAAAMAGACQLERRVLAITTPARRDEPGLAVLAAAAVAGAFVMLVAAAGSPVRPVTAPLDAPSIEPIAPVARSLPGTSDEQASEPATAFTGEDARPPESRRPTDTQPIEAPVPQAPRPRLDAEQAVAANPPPAREIAASQAPPAPLPAAPRTGVYGPQLPRQLAMEQEQDPRIPEALRSRRPRPEPQDDRAAGRSTAHTIARRVLEIIPSVLMLTEDQSR